MPLGAHRKAVLSRLPQTTINMNFTLQKNPEIRNFYVYVNRGFCSRTPSQRDRPTRRLKYVHRISYPHNPFSRLRLTAAKIVAIPLPMSVRTALFPKRRTSKP